MWKKGSCMALQNYKKYFSICLRVVKYVAGKLRSRQLCWWRMVAWWLSYCKQSWFPLQQGTQYTTLTLFSCNLSIHPTSKRCSQTECATHPFYWRLVVMGHYQEISKISILNQQQWLSLTSCTDFRSMPSVRYRTPDLRDSQVLMYSHNRANRTCFRCVIWVGTAGEHYPFWIEGVVSYFKVNEFVYRCVDVRKKRQWDDYPTHKSQRGWNQQRGGQQKSSTHCCFLGGDTHFPC